MTFLYVEHGANGVFILDHEFWEGSQLPKGVVKGDLGSAVRSSADPLLVNFVHFTDGFLR